jgi:hypothetical protein
MAPDLLLFGYVFLPLLALTVLWAVRAFSQRRFLPGPAEDRVFRCSRCATVYTDDPDVDLSRCPQCGLLNERFDFRV